MRHFPAVYSIMGAQKKVKRFSYARTNVAASSIGYTKPKESSQGEGGDLQSKYSLTLTVARKKHNERRSFGKACQKNLDTLLRSMPEPAGFAT